MEWVIWFIIGSVTAILVYYLLEYLIGVIVDYFW